MFSFMDNEKKRSYRFQNYFTFALFQYFISVYNTIAFHDKILIKKKTNKIYFHSFKRTVSCFANFEAILKQNKFFHQKEL